MRRRRSLALIAVGAGSGVIAAGLDLAVAQAIGSGYLVAAIPILLITVVGLGLGALAASSAYVTATLVLIATLVLFPHPPEIIPDSARLLTFVLGTPLVIALVRRAELAGEEALAARDASREAERLARREGEELELARRELSAALGSAERERARLEEVAEAIPEPLVVYGADLRGTYANRAALRLFGRSFVERPLDEWARGTEPRDPRGGPLPREAWPQVAAQEGPIRRRLIVRLPMSGRDLLIDVEGTPIPGGGCVLLLRDVGREEEERRRLSRFASFVAHELRNPLAVVKARIELTERAAGRSERLRLHATRARESVDSAISILERLELYSRAELGRIEAQRQPFSLADAVNAATERLRAHGSERDLRVSVPAELQALGDRHLSEQAITNLLTNAERYSEPGAPIRIEAQGNGAVELRVADGGPGIADDVAERLFRDRVETKGGRGLGLGLLLVRSTMEAQGGSVELTARRPGAVFTLRWPPADGRR